MSKVFIVLNVRDDTESKYLSIVFLSIFERRLRGLGVMNVKGYENGYMAKLKVSMTRPCIQQKVENLILRVCIFGRMG